MSLHGLPRHPDRALPGRPDPEDAVHPRPDRSIIFEKYGRHLALHRVDKELARLGAEIPEATRDRWLRWAATQLNTLFVAMKRLTFAVGMIHTDGTGLDVIEPKLGTRLGQVAVFGNHVATLFDFTPTKHGIHQRRATWRATQQQGRQGAVHSPSAPGRRTDRRGTRCPLRTKGSDP